MSQAHTIDIMSLIPLDNDSKHVVVELYVAPERAHRDASTVNVGWKQVPASLQFILKGSAVALYEYHHRDIVCSYDASNDAQKVIRKIHLAERCEANLFAMSYVEEVLPSHMFPCTRDISKEGKVLRYIYRINNRMCIVLDEEDGWSYVYVKYQHAPNVDVRKMQEDFDKAIRKLTRPVK